MYGVIVLLVVGGLVFITINNDNQKEETSPVSEVDVSEDLDNMEIQNEEEKSEAGTESEIKEGVKITILSEGTGEVAEAGNLASVNYTGSLEDGTVFDSNIDPKFGHVEPFTFTLGIGQVIPGWDQGVLGMKVGEKRKLEIAPEYAYGASGVGGVIPPNATLLFEVELLAVEK